MEPPDPFPGFLPPTSNTTYTPNQFFDVVLPYASRGAVRLVGYMIRKTLGWSDADGNPQEPQAVVSYRELEQEAGIGHSMIRKAVEDAIAGRFIHCLRPGQPDTRQARAISALYELRWETRNLYIADPTQFDGFFAGNGNLTYIPNEFFDYLLPQESLAVIRVVGAIVRHTIGFQTQYGFRRQQVQMSVTSLEKRTNLSRKHVRLAIQEALAKNYIRLVREGLFDPNAAKQSLAATYGIKWRDGFLGERELPLQPALPFEQTPPQRDTAPKRNMSKSALTNDHSEKEHGKYSDDSPDLLRKGTRDHSEKEHGDHSEKEHDIKITGNNTYIKNSSSRASEPDTLFAAAAYIAATPGSPPPVATLQSAASEESPQAYQLLLTAGFDESMARRLASAQPLESIRRQITWLPRRNPVRNRLGMLRRAIEESWPEPPQETAGVRTPTAPADSATDHHPESPGALFAAAFYAGWAGNQGKSLAPPSVYDIRAAIPYVQALLQLWPDASQVPEWGRHFGAFARHAEQDNPKAVRSLVYALRSHSDDYYLQFQERRKREVRQARLAAQREHEQRYQEAYLDYLRACKQQIQLQRPQTYAAFEAEEQAQRRKYQTGFFATTRQLSQKMLEAFDRENDHLQRFRQFFQERMQQTGMQEDAPGVLDFWDWDARLNPHRRAIGEPDA